jgi:hypothetical protein
VNRTYGASAVLQMLDTWLPLVEPASRPMTKRTVSFTRPDEPDRVSVAFTIRVEDRRAAYKELVADALRSSPRLGWCRSPRLAPLDHKAPAALASFACYTANQATHA